MKMNLRELVDTVCDEGYSQANAEARVCQDIVLKAIDISREPGCFCVGPEPLIRSLFPNAPQKAAVPGRLRNTEKLAVKTEVKKPLFDVSLLLFFRFPCPV